MYITPQFTAPFQIVRVRASETFLGLDCLFSALLWRLFPFGKILEKSSYFSVRLVQKQSFVFFVTDGIRFFSVKRVKRLVHLITSVR